MREVITAARADRDGRRQRSAIPYLPRSADIPRALHPTHHESHEDEEEKGTEHDPENGELTPPRSALLCVVAGLRPMWCRVEWSICE